MSERTQALADAILALTWIEMQSFGTFVGEFIGEKEPNTLTNAHFASAIYHWGDENRAPTVEVIVEDEQPKGAG